MIFIPPPNLLEIEEYGKIIWFSFFSFFYHNFIYKRFMRVFIIYKFIYIFF